LFEEDAIHFHNTQKKSCDSFDQSLYPKFKGSVMITSAIIIEEGNEEV
jgi:Coproporphyrinogen III oxidase